MITSSFSLCCADDRVGGQSEVVTCRGIAIYLYPYIS